MAKASWRSQLAIGRVFELRSTSQRFPAPCALVLDDSPSYVSRRFAAVDCIGVTRYGLYGRKHNPKIFVESLRLEQFNSQHIKRRRPDLERFDRDDLALVRYGLNLDFSGRISGMYSDMHIPIAVPADWTVFWLPAWAKDDHRWVWFETDELYVLLRGAWYFDSHGGSRHLGYCFGRAWGTRHTGFRLDQIRDHLFRYWGSSIVEQEVKVAQWNDGENLYTEEIRRDCPALGMRACLVQTRQGIQGIYR